MEIKVSQKSHQPLLKSNHIRSATVLFGLPMPPSPCDKDQNTKSANDQSAPGFEVKSQRAAIQDKALTEILESQKSLPGKDIPAGESREPNWLDLDNPFAPSALPEAARLENLKKAKLVSTDGSNERYVYPDGTQVIRNNKDNKGHINYSPSKNDSEWAGYQKIENFGPGSIDTRIAYAKQGKNDSWLYKYSDGSVAYTNKDGSAGRALSVLDKDGTFNIRHWGLKENDNFTLTHKADGSITRTNKNKTESSIRKTTNKINDSSAKSDHHSLWTSLAHKRAELDIHLATKAHDSKRVHEILDTLEKRCQQNNGLTHPSAGNLTDAYQSAINTLDKPGVGIFSDENRKASFVLEGLRNLSDVTGIDQGHDIPSEPRPGSCGQTNAEKFIAQRDAAVYMRALQQIAQTGKAQVGDIMLTPTDLKSGLEEQNWSVYNEGGSFRLGNYVYEQDGNRNLASKAMQNLCSAFAIHNKHSVNNGINHIVVEDFTKAMTGTAMITVGPTGADKSPNKIHEYLNDNIAIKLKNEGRLPAMVFQGYHWTSIHDVKQVQCTDARTGNTITRTQVYWDNQYGRKCDRGWVYPECIR